MEEPPEKNKSVPKKRARRGSGTLSSRKRGRQESKEPVPSLVVTDVAARKDPPTDSAGPSQLVREPNQEDIPSSPEDATAQSNRARDEVVPCVDILPHPDRSVVDEVVSGISGLLPPPWICLPDTDGVTDIVMISRVAEKAIQRRAYFSFTGEKVISVHRKLVESTMSNNILGDSANIVLTKQTKDSFIQQVLSVVNRFRSYDICGGVPETQLKCLWETDLNGEKDKNPYGELRYSETFRPFKCHLLVSTEPVLKQRCLICVQEKKRLTKRLQNRTACPNSSTRNEVMDRQQLLGKLSRQHQDLQYARAQIVKLTAKVQDAISQDGVFVDKNLSLALSSNLTDAKLTPAQELFVKEQLKAASVRNPCGRRWYPTMLRFALLLKSTSTSAYQAVKDSGVIILPYERTLYEYSHFMLPEAGCTSEKLTRLCRILADKYPKGYQQFHVLLMDQMHINQKLVYQKSSGEMVGYLNLSEVEQEVINNLQLESQLKGKQAPDTSIMASEMLTFMIKGVASGLSEIVASFPTSDNLDSEQLFDRVWEVVGALERSGIKIIAIVSDGAAANRSFYACHPALTKDANVVFDTLNLAAPRRPIYFFSDHLLKTMRNCFYKSGSGTKYTRLLTKNNEVIVWQTIRKLFEEDKSKNLRRCYKLNSNNVNLNSFSVMNVRYAAQVMSNTVASDLESRNWPGTSETVTFIKKVNDFFDMLNGCHSSKGHRKANSNLDPYVSAEDTRFNDLLDFLDYLKKWKSEVAAKPGYTAPEKAKMVLSQQTLDGVEMTVRSFIAATKYMLTTCGVKYVNAAVFCQDPLERYFSKQWQSGGGSRNPTVA